MREGKERRKKMGGDTRREGWYVEVMRKVVPWLGQMLCLCSSSFSSFSFRPSNLKIAWADRPPKCISTNKH